MTDLTDERLAEMEREATRTGLDAPPHRIASLANNVVLLITALREERAEVSRLQERVRVLEKVSDAAITSLRSFDKGLAEHHAATLQQKEPEA